jgi:superfamily II DNA/RNA helicase
MMDNTEHTAKSIHLAMDEPIRRTKTCRDQIRRIIRATVPGEAVAIAAPTGTGKTTAMYRQVCAMKSKRTLFMLHTRLSIRALEAREGKSPPHVRIYTPRGMLKAINDIFCGSQSVDNVVIDEAHVQSPEYEAILGLVSRLHASGKTRLFLMSATLDETRINQDIPGARLIHIPVSSKFPEQIVYSGYPCNEDFYLESNYPPPATDVVNKVSSLIGQAIEKSEKRVLVFLPSHDLCERVRRAVSAKTKECDVISIHGGLSDEDLEKNRKRMMDPNEKDIVCCTTNMSETAVTFPGITDVIDSGLRCAVRGGRIVTEWCDRASMIQRAGRTNRTCAGTVYRCITETGFQSIPMHRPPEHDYDSVVLDLLQNKIEPTDALGEKAEPSLMKIRENGVSPKMYHFLSRSKLLIEHGVVLYKLIQRTTRFSYPKEFTALVVLCVTIMSLLQTRPMAWMYMDREMNRSARAREIARVRRWASVEDDPLATLAMVFCRVFTSEDPKKMAADYSLNFRILREHRARFRALMRLCFHLDEKNPGEEAAVLGEVSWDLWGNSVRGFLSDTLLTARYPVPVDPCLQDIEVSRYFGEDNVSTLWTLGTRMDYVYKKPRYALPLVISSRGNRWVVEDVVLWTWVGEDFRMHPYTLESHVEEAEREKEEKRKWRTAFTEGAVREIFEEVAFRPGMHGMMMALEDFHANVVSQN